MPAARSAGRGGGRDPHGARASRLPRGRRHRPGRRPDADGGRRRPAAPRGVEPGVERGAGGGEGRPRGRDREPGEPGRERQRPGDSGGPAGPLVRAVRHGTDRGHRAGARHRAARGRGPPRPRACGLHGGEGHDVHRLLPRSRSERGSRMTYAAAVPTSPVSPSRAGTESRATHLYVMVAACAAIVDLGALWNRFAFDDVAIVVMNPLVGHLSGLWKAFAAPYWTPDLGGSMYRPLTIATFALDRAVDGAAWLHAVNLAWHAAASVAA